MKKKFISVVSTILAIVTVLSLTVALSSCQLTDELNKALEDALSEAIEEMANGAYARGTTSGAVYSSAFLGIQITLPSSDWRFYTDDEIKDANGNAKAVVDDETFASAVDMSQFEFMAVTSSGADNANMTVVKGSSGTDLEATAKEAVDYVVATYTNLGYTCSAGTPAKKTVAGMEFWTVDVTITYLTVNLKQYIYFIQAGNYIYSLSFTTTTGITVEEFEATISAID